MLYLFTVVVEMSYTKRLARTTLYKDGERRYNKSYRLIALPGAVVIDILCAPVHYHNYRERKRHERQQCQEEFERQHRELQRKREEEQRMKKEKEEEEKTKLKSELEEFKKNFKSHMMINNIMYFWNDSKWANNTMRTRLQMDYEEYLPMEAIYGFMRSERNKRSIAYCNEDCKIECHYGIDGFVAREFITPDNESKLKEYIIEIFKQNPAAYISEYEYKYNASTTRYYRDLAIKWDTVMNIKFNETVAEYLKDVVCSNTVEYTFKGKVTDDDCINFMKKHGIDMPVMNTNTYNEYTSYHDDTYYDDYRDIQYREECRRERDEAYNEVKREQWENSRSNYGRSDWENPWR